MPTGGRRKKGAKKDPRPETIEAVPQWIVAPGGIGHAVRSRNPTVARCGQTGFTGGFFTAATPSRMCVECRAWLKSDEQFPSKPDRPASPEETQGRLF